MYFFLNRYWLVLLNGSRIDSCPKRLLQSPKLGGWIEERAISFALTDVRYTIWATKTCADVNEKLGKNTWFGSSVAWELVYFILSFATVVRSVLVNAVEEGTLPFKFLRAVFWLREQLAEVIKKDLGNVGLGHHLFCSVSQQSEMIYKWSDGGVSLFLHRCWDLLNPAR